MINIPKAAQDAARVLDTIRLLAPLVQEVHAWLDGDGAEPVALRTLPNQLQSELALERAKRRAAQP